MKKKMKALMSVCVKLVLTLFLLIACIDAVKAQSYSVNVGTGFGKPRKYFGTKRVGIQASVERKTFFDISGISVSPFLAYAQYLYDDDGYDYSSPLKYHTLTIGNAISIYPLELLSEEKYAEKRYQLYFSISAAYDWILIPDYDGGLGYTNLYLGAYVGARYKLANWLKVYGELGKTPSGIFGLGLSVGG